MLYVGSEVIKNFEAITLRSYRGEEDSWATLPRRQAVGGTGSHPVSMQQSHRGSSKQRI